MDNPLDLTTNFPPHIIASLDHLLAQAAKRIDRGIELRATLSKTERDPRLSAFMAVGGTDDADKAILLLAVIRMSDMIIDLREELAGLKAGRN